MILLTMLLLALAGSPPLPAAAQATTPPSAQPSALPSTLPSTLPSVLPTTPPSPLPTAAPSMAPTAAPTPRPAPAPQTPSPYTYRFVPHQPDHITAGQPQIFAVYLNGKRLLSQGPILIKVQTNEDVVKVVSRSSGREGIIPQVSPGDFEAKSTLPKIPFIASGVTLDLEFIATSADGRKAIVRVPVRLD